MPCWADDLCHLLSQPIKDSYDKAEITKCRLAKWALLFSPYDIHFISQKSMEGQEIADFIAEHPISKNAKLHDDILDEATKVHHLRNNHGSCFLMVQ